MCVCVCACVRVLYMCHYPCFCVCLYQFVCVIITYSFLIVCKLRHQCQVVYTGVNPGYEITSKIPPAPHSAGLHVMGYSSEHARVIVTDTTRKGIYYNYIHDFYAFCIKSDSTFKARLSDSVLCKSFNPKKMSTVLILPPC